MSIKFPCPNCKKTLTAKEEQAGRKTTCPACKKPLVIPGPAGARPRGAKPAPGNGKTAARSSAPSPEDVEAAAAAVFSDAPAADAAAPTSIDFNCEYCDTAISLPLTEAGKRSPCPECKRILKVPTPAKAEPSNWRRAGAHLPSAAKRPDEPAPEGAWGNLTRTVVSLEALEEADAIPEKPEPVSLRDRVVSWSTRGVFAACVLAAATYAYVSFTANRERRAADAALAYASDPLTVKKIGRPSAGALHTLAGEYLIRTRVPYSDAPLAGQAGSGEQARIEFEHALKLLQDDTPSAERDLALGDLALAMVELGGDKDEERDRLRLSWKDCLLRVLAALNSIEAPQAKREAYREVARRLFALGQPAGAVALASTAFSESPGERLGARAMAALEQIDLSAADPSAAAKAKADAAKTYDDIAKEFESVKEPPPLAAEVVTLALIVGKVPPKPGKALSDDENAWAGDAEGVARKGRLPEARERANSAPSPEMRLQSLVAIGSATKPGTEDFVTACSVALGNLPEPARESWQLLRLVRLGSLAGVPAERLEKVAALIPDAGIRGRAKLALFRKQLAEKKEPVGTELAEGVEPHTVAHNLALADIARHNAAYDGSYYRKAQNWPEPDSAFGTFSALMALQKGAD